MHHRISTAPLSYDFACGRMEEDLTALKIGEGPEVLWFLEHPPLYTYGARTDPLHRAMAEKTGLPLYPSPRGGQLTYHGPGQRILYLLLDLRLRGLGVKEYMFLLQEWLVRALGICGIKSWARPEHVGLWTDFGKVASLGVRVSRGVSSHGVALNVLKESARGFDAVVPCGLVGMPMGTLQDSDPFITRERVDGALCETNPFFSFESFS